MKLFKTLTYMSLVTLIALIYVHQQVELVKLSYSINNKEKMLKVMLDRKDRLGYNVYNLEAPSRLESVLLSKNVDIAFPKRSNVVKVAKVGQNAESEKIIRNSALEGKFNFFGILEFFSPRAEAQAEEK
jgi:hypothetical protein